MKKIDVIDVVIGISIISIIAILVYFGIFFFQSNQNTKNKTSPEINISTQSAVPTITIITPSIAKVTRIDGMVFEVNKNNLIVKQYKPVNPNDRTITYYDEPYTITANSTTKITLKYISSKKESTIALQDIYPHDVVYVLSVIQDPKDPHKIEAATIEVSRMDNRVLDKTPLPLQ